MEAKQRNFRLPLFVHDELDELLVELRRIGTKPLDQDLVAALIHAAHAAVDETKAAFEAFVIHELALEEAEKEESSREEAD
jgi:hypothetical protein